MKQYAEFHNSNLYHIMKNKTHTVCSISVVAQTTESKLYAKTDYPLPKIVNIPSFDKTLCKKCDEKDSQ